MNNTMQAQIDDYIYFKMIQSMVFGDYIDTILEHETWQNDINSIGFLKALKNLIITNEKQQVIEPIIKDGLHKIINHLRFNKPYQTTTERQENYEIYNHLITTLNISEDKNKYKFYAEELCKRYNHNGLSGKVMSLIYTPLIIEMDKKYLFNSISNDFGVIANQSNLVDDYNFEGKVMPDYISNHYYIDSINAIINEEPYLFRDFIFLNRTYGILEENKETKKTIDKYFVKRNNKALKRIDNFM